MSKSPFIAALLLAALGRAAGAQPPSIVHDPVACAVAEKFPRLFARFDPKDNVAVARLVFQGQTADWYSVAMKAEGASFVGVLPKPRKELKSFRYYVEVTDKALGVSRTSEFTTSIVPSSGACKGGLVSATVASASVVLQGPAGLAAIPAGFAPAGVIAGGAASGAATGTAAAGTGSSAGGVAAGAAAAGGGLGATALVIGGVAVAGGAAVVASKGGDDGSSSGSNSNSNVAVLLQVSITASSGSSGSISTPNIDVSVCRPGTTFGGGPINVRNDGSFDEIWNLNSPALRVVGRADASGLTATLTCSAGGGPTGSMSATGSGYSLNGTFSFGSSQFGSQGTISVRRSP